jgi:SAM-dependent methyltransferase
MFPWRDGPYCDPQNSPKPEKTLLRGVDVTLHAHDGMYRPFEGRHYLSVGLSAMRCIEAGIADEPKRILDLPCGYGRVLRFLLERFPDAEIIASELNQEGLAFCGSRFAVSAVPSKADLSKVSITGAFDLIWCGSLLTHLPVSQAAEVLRFFCRHLSPGGTCIVTTQGEPSAAFEITTANAGIRHADLGRLKLKPLI